MADMMSFPKTIKEFIDDDSFFEKAQIYTNDSQLISVFRIYQALEHYAPELLNNSLLLKIML
jgi:hypothetical protein